MRLAHTPLAFVDIETSSMDRSAEILEIAILRVENNSLTQVFSTLIKPQNGLDVRITNLTGITEDMLKTAPDFNKIVDNITSILNDCVFIAHSVAFDYGFIRQALAKEGHSYRPQLLDTVELSRKLYPLARPHTLEALIGRHGLKVTDRHRALDDAHAIWQFYQLALNEFDLDTIERLWRPRLPKLAG